MIDLESVVPVTTTAAAAAVTTTTAKFCLLNNQNEECFPLRRLIPGGDGMDTKLKLGKVCLRHYLSSGNVDNNNDDDDDDEYDNDMLDVNYSTEDSDYVIKEAHFWFGTELPQPSLEVDFPRNYNQDTTLNTENNVLPDVRRFPFFTTLREGKFSTLWNEEIDMNRQIMCRRPVKDDEISVRYFSAQAILVPAKKYNTNFPPMTAFATVDEQYQFRTLESFFIACSCSGTVYEENNDNDQTKPTQIVTVDEENNSDGVHSSTASTTNSNVPKEELLEQVKQTKQERAEQKLQHDETMEAELEEEMVKNKSEEEELEQKIQQEKADLQEKWTQIHERNNLNTTAEADGSDVLLLLQDEDEDENEKVKHETLEKELQEQVRHKVDLDKELQNDKTAEKTLELKIQQEKADLKKKWDQIHKDDKLDALLETKKVKDIDFWLDEEEQQQQEEDVRDFVEEQDGEVDHHIDIVDDENDVANVVAEPVLVYADELELTTSFLVVVPDQKHYMDVLMDEATLHETESKIEASKGLHQAWFTFVEQIMGDLGVPSINVIKELTNDEMVVTSSRSSEMNVRRTTATARSAKSRQVSLLDSTVTIEWEENSPTLFKFLIVTQCPPDTIEYLLNDKKKQQHHLGSKGMVDMGSSPKELIRSGTSQARTEVTCYKAFGMYKVLHLLSPVKVKEEVVVDDLDGHDDNKEEDEAVVFQDLENDSSSASRQEICDHLFRITRQAMKESRLGQDLPNDVPFLIHGGQPESCLPTGYTTTVMKPVGLKEDLTKKANVSSSLYNDNHSTHTQQNEPLWFYQLHNDDDNGSWNVTRLGQLIAYLCTSVFTIVLFVTIYCYLLPKVDAETRNRVTDDWSEPSMRPQRTGTSGRGRNSRTNWKSRDRTSSETGSIDNFAWLE